VERFEDDRGTQGYSEHFLVIWENEKPREWGQSCEPVARAAERALDGTLDQRYTHLTSLDFSNAFNTVDRQDIAEGLRQYAPVLYRAGRWAYGCTSSLVLSSPEGRHIITSAQGVRQGDPMGPLMF
jgi:hypothetical protein